LVENVDPHRGKNWRKGWVGMPLSLWLALLVTLTALGVVLRQVAIPVAVNITLTPGFMAPLLTGLLLGPVAGVVCGVIVGLSGALTEWWLLPVMGNIALGLSTGILSLVRGRLPLSVWVVLCMVMAVVVGGFLPTFAEKTVVELLPAFAAAIEASIDAAQAGVWAAVALLLEASVVRPLLRHLLPEGEEGGVNTDRPGDA